MTTRQIIICRELIDLADYILYMGLWNEERGDWSEFGETRELWETLVAVSDAHNKIFGAYGHIQTDDIDRLAMGLRHNLLDLIGGFRPRIEERRIDHEPYRDEDVL